MDIGIFKEIANGINSPEGIKYLRNKALKWIVLFSVIPIVFIHILEPFGHHLVESHEMYSNLKSFIYGLPLFSIIFFNAEIHRANQRFSVYAFFKNFGVYLLLTIVLGVKLFIWDWPFEYFSQFFLIALILLSSLSFIGTGSFEGKNSIQTSDFKAFFKNSLPIGITALCFFLIQWLDGIVLAQYYSDRIVGLYAVAFRIAIIGSFILTAINSAFGPRISQLSTEGKIDELFIEARNSTKLGFWLTVPLILIIIIFPDFILSFFGSEFLEAKTAMFIVLSGQLVNVIVGPTGTLLQLSGYQRQFKNIIVFTAVVTIILNYLTIPVYGMIGAAVVNAAGLAFWNIWSTLLVRKKYGKTFYYLPFLRK